MSGDAQDQSEIFNGTAAVGLKDPRSVDGTDTRAVPAFVLGEELADLAEHDPRIVVLTADLGRSNRALDFAARHPDRFVNVGIAEKNMVTIAAGMAASGYLPFAATFGSFAALLCAEQIRTDCAYPGLPVRVVGHHSGMSMGFYGTSHHSLEDLAMMRSIADLTTVCATDAHHLRAVLRLSVDQPGAMYLRLGRGRDPQVYEEVPDLVPGRALTVRETGAHHTDLTIIATGSEVHPALGAADVLAGYGLSTRVVDMWTVSPLDTDAVLDAAATSTAVLTVEEANISGGLGSAVAECLADAGVATRLRRHGVPDEHVPVGPPAALYAHYRLDAPGIADVALELLLHDRGTSA